MFIPENLEGLLCYRTGRHLKADRAKVSFVLLTWRGGPEGRQGALCIQQRISLSDPVTPAGAQIVMTWTQGETGAKRPSSSPPLLPLFLVERIYFYYKRIAWHGNTQFLL